ncbi:MAG TPA: VOC family protein [Actinomycetota bacterium]|jgi:predicted 3-demethylubiquinone-9 3-methyltransferase (glyoxalase superfamily)|nr:VOC family protein [Actinomycetota bacterium]
MQKISPFLWFDSEAEAAVTFYLSLFEDSRITTTLRYPQNSTIGEPGSVMSLGFELNGQQFMALNGGPEFRFTPAISFYVHCEDQAEIDRLWNALLDGGEPQQCGWITDRFGVTWQIVPTILDTFLTDEDQEKVQRVTEAFLKMEKFDIPTLEAAYAG